MVKEPHAREKERAKKNCEKQREYGGGGGGGEVARFLVLFLSFLGGGMGADKKTNTSGDKLQCMCNEKNEITYSE